VDQNPRAFFYENSTTPTKATTNEIKIKAVLAWLREPSFSAQKPVPMPVLVRSPKKAAA
jgi:hypothetical protein